MRKLVLSMLCIGSLNAKALNPRENPNVKVTTCWLEGSGTEAMVVKTLDGAIQAAEYVDYERGSLGQPADLQNLSVSEDGWTLQVRDKGLYKCVGNIF